MAKLIHKYMTTHFPGLASCSVGLVLWTQTFPLV